MAATNAVSLSMIQRNPFVEMTMEAKAGRKTHGTKNVSL